ncbi:UDP-N-acetylmuramate dehydrogenase [Leptospira licerasiae]|uniref:UDP-N-acetylenolpyruvoylglucosamine reductase n=1 Tax=Leptospira licerasiae str. MMD4847 TaxID=1049971 RepID=A0ABN0HA35_9LEPT|nr:UDP-N-acetylmuramate dehydrogenase [Leptospira licerasiae]EIE02641.1 UDP-N-acetylmuramate dehydrogenase [Leptospira licerasiae serovar Varillal str. VAR 010]EJZ42474.1 UDP-N-acetylmuramate dehydrogenase [Leptospira licerasiae str. MMD4847]
MAILSEIQIRELKNSLENSGLPYRENQDLSVNCSFKIGGISPLIVEPETREQILETLSLFKRLEMPWKILGGGTNILISDHPDDFVILKLSGGFKEYKDLGEGYFQVGAATNTTPVFRQISQKGYTGAEFLSTIPGWTGGAVIQNAGCYGGELFDLIQEVEFLRNGEVLKRKPSEIEHGYRFTEFLKRKDSIILSVLIKLKRGNLEEIEASLKEKRDKRNSSQPQNKKSAGSMFKNPKVFDEHGKEIKAWQFIDKVGLRGLQIGGAQISPEHCNFIVNIGGAKASDVYGLVNTVQEKVEKETGVILQREVEYFGSIP